MRRYFRLLQHTEKFCSFSVVTAFPMALRPVINVPVMLILFCGMSFALTIFGCGSSRSILVHCVILFAVRCFRGFIVVLVSSSGSCLFVRQRANYAGNRDQSIRAWQFKGDKNYSPINELCLKWVSIFVHSHVHKNNMDFPKVESFP